nr:hypothetical protein GCM10020093_060140 [Planobispora longispora]
MKLGTVRSRIHRGRAQLRDALEHRAPRGDHFPNDHARGGIRMREQRGPEVSTTVRGECHDEPLGKELA